MEDVLDVVVETMDLDADTEWRLLLMDDDNEIEDLALQNNMKIKPLGTAFFLAGPKQPDHTTEEQPPVNRSSIGEYSQYRVVKTNEKGKRQARILGIDAKSLHNKKPGGTGGVWRRQRNLKEVTAVTKLSRPGCFSIRFANGTAREYECEVPSEVDEIVDKITMLKSALLNR